MSHSLSAKQFFSSNEGALVRQVLEEMMTDPAFNTESTYSPASEDRVLFVDKHMDYLSKHPQVNNKYYVSNLRLMTRIR